MIGQASEREKESEVKEGIAYIFLWINILLAYSFYLRRDGGFI